MKTRKLLRGSSQQSERFHRICIHEGLTPRICTDEGNYPEIFTAEGTYPQDLKLGPEEVPQHRHVHLKPKRRDSLKDFHN